jgi:hypothetical protein
MSLDYQPRQMEFSVRWYWNLGVRNCWNAQTLDRIRFAPMAAHDAFGFGCLIIPAFAKGVLHRDGKGMSFCARDSSDWTEYYVNR